MQYLKDHTAERFIKDHYKVVIFFTASWCKPCETMKKTFHSYMLKHSAEYAYACVDIDSAIEFSDRANVLSVPTIMYFVDNRYIGRLVGNRPEKKIAELLESA